MGSQMLTSHKSPSPPYALLIMTSDMKHSDVSKNEALVNPQIILP